MKIGFFRAFTNICCGTEVFPWLAKHSVGKVIWHLFLMSFFCSLIMTLAFVGRATDEWKAFRERFCVAFGEKLSLSEKGIVPVKDPGKERFIILPGSGGLLYTGNRREVKFPAGFTSGANYFLVWNDCCFVVGMRSGDKEWQLRLINPDKSFSVIEKVSEDELPATLVLDIANIRAAGNKWDLPQKNIGSLWLCLFFKNLIVTVFFFAELLEVLFLALVCTIVFSLISRLTGASSLRGVNGLEYWKIGVYAGFPGMLIGSVASALELPILSYGIAYSVALVIYWMPASMACVQKNDADGDESGRNT